MFSEEIQKPIFTQLEEVMQAGNFDLSPLPLREAWTVLGPMSDYEKALFVLSHKLGVAFNLEQEAYWGSPEKDGSDPKKEVELTLQLQRVQALQGLFWAELYSRFREKAFNLQMAPDSTGQILVFDDGASASFPTTELELPELLAKTVFEQLAEIKALKDFFTGEDESEEGDNLLGDLNEDEKALLTLFHNFVEYGQANEVAIIFGINERLTKIFQEKMSHLSTLFWSDIIARQGMKSQEGALSIRTGGKIVTFQKQRVAGDAFPEVP